MHLAAAWRDTCRCSSFGCCDWSAVRRYSCDRPIRVIIASGNADQHEPHLVQAEQDQLLPGLILRIFLLIPHRPDRFSVSACASTSFRIAVNHDRGGVCINRRVSEWNEKSNWRTSRIIEAIALKLISVFDEWFGVEILWVIYQTQWGKIMKLLMFLDGILRSITKNVIS